MLQDNKDELVIQCAELMRKVWDEIRTSPTPSRSETEFTISQGKAMRILRQGERCMSDVAAGLGVGVSSATHVIERLVDKGLVKRSDDPEDRRLVLCSLTEAGEQVMDDKANLDTAELRAVAKLLDVEELQMVMRSMKALNKVLQNRDRQGRVASEPAEDTQFANLDRKIVTNSAR